MTQRPISASLPPRPSRTPPWPRRRPRRRLLPQFLELLGIVAFLVIAYHGALWIWAATAPKETKVPRIVGLEREEAIGVLRRLGLGAEVAVEKVSEEVEEGKVITSEPAPGRGVKVGRTIRLTVSMGSRWCRVPDVGDMSVDRAEALLREAKLVVRRQRARYDAKVPVGYVIGQKPEAGARVLRGTDVELLVSKGAKPETVVVEEEPPPRGPRSTEIELTVPPGASLQEVKVIVQDREGTRVVYQAYHQPGETVEQTVSGEGPSVTVQVYLSGLLVESKTI